MEQPIKQITKDTRITTSNEQWAGFNTWMQRMGCTSLAEGIRTAIRYINAIEQISRDQHHRECLQNKIENDNVLISR